MNLNRLFVGLTALIVASASLFAQNIITTPYSNYGYGILGDNASSAQKAMGGVGYAMNSGRQVNAMNPASYARVDSLTFLFDMGLNFNKSWSTEVNELGSENKEKNGSAGLEYITMQFQLTKGLGMSVGLLPFSRVGYAYANDIPNGYTSREGQGSINQAYLGLGGQIFEGFTIGANMAYLFGTTNKFTYAVTDGSSTSLFENEMEMRDWRLTLGAQYTLNLGKNVFTLGLVYSPGKKMLGHQRLFAYDVDTDITPIEVSSINLKDTHEMAATYGVGLGYTWNQRLMAEVDFTYQPWKDCKYNGSTGQLANRYKVAAGLQYQPSLRGGYFRRIQYRAGGFYNRDYLMVNDNNVREYGATVGLGLPVPGFKTIVNIGLGWLHRQTSPAAQIKEDYLNFTIGVNFNEMWFRKSKIY